MDARELGTKMRKSLGDKRKELAGPAIEEIVRLYDAASDSSSADDERIKILPNETFGFQRITVERPMRRRWVVSAETLDVLSADGRDVYAPLLGSSWATSKDYDAAVKALPGDKAAKDVKADSNP